MPTPPYTSLEVADLADVSYRCLDYWVRTGVVEPSISDAAGSGTRRRWSETDLEEVRLVSTLLELGVALDTIREQGSARETLAYLRDRIDPLAELYLERETTSVA